jgi:hypothetical protein
LVGRFGVVQVVTDAAIPDGVDAAAVEAASFGCFAVLDD